MEEEVTMIGQPIAVFMPCHPVQKPSFDGTFQIPPESGQTPHLIGFLSNPPVVQTAKVSEGTFEKRKTELKQALGLELALYIMPSVNSDGEVGCGIFYGVEVAGMAQAKTLPGFAGCGMWSGYQFIAPQLNKSTLLRFGGSVEEHCMPEGCRPPKYTDGIATVSMIPGGQIGEMVFFQDMPDRVFVVPGMDTIRNAAETARAFRGG